MTGTSHTPSPAGPTASGSGPGRRRYVIGSDEPELLRALADRFVRTGEALVQRVIGAEPSVLVVEAPDPVVERLRNEHGDRLIVEVDSELPEPGPVQPPGM
jgi:hypothetical protein